MNTNFEIVDFESGEILCREGETLTPGMVNALDKFVQYNIGHVLEPENARTFMRAMFIVAAYKQDN